ncbi:Protein of unknown function (DUF3755 [Striga hermonthica]|uniref:Uncharacterized protein n=1 Tax=Striga hermonthica TaxID=68872 RepID=A0A9N7MTP2_STRHE|nr:Protein of unknown function (DUF3755 [Striga hermonthica]
MASESSTGFHQHHRRGMSAGEVVSGGCELIPMGSYMFPRGAMGLGGNNEGIVFPSQNSSCATTFLVDSVPGLKHDTGLATEWSIDEQYTLEEGLARCAREPNILRYIKIAATLRNKTVRDVALRCRWMTRKRRKLEDMRFGIKEKDLKEKIELSLKNAMSSASSVKVAPYSLTANHHDPSKYILSGVLSGKTRHLLEENYQAFVQISTNLTTLKLQQNMDLFTRTRNNLTTILNDMRNMPGVMSQMPPLPVLLDVQLANSILPLSSKPMSLSSSGMRVLKQEPDC